MTLGNETTDLEVKELLRNELIHASLDGSGNVTFTNGTVTVAGGIDSQGSLNFSSNDSIQSSGVDAITFDASQNVGMPNGSLNMGLNKITSLGAPTNPNDAARKDYVDSVAQGLDIKDSVAVASTANIDLSSATDPNPVDGYTIQNDDRVLLKDQTNAAENGIYVANTATDPTTWTRAADFDEDNEVTNGAFTFVENGTKNGSTSWIVTSEDPITVGTDDIIFAQFSSAGTITAGDGLVKSGQELSVDEAFDFTFTSKLDFSAGLDTQGDITDGAQVIWDASAQEIPDSAMGSIANSTLANSSVTITAGDGLKNGGSVSLGGSVTLNIEPADFAGSFLSDDGADNLAVDIGSGLENDGSGNIRVDEDFDFTFTSAIDFTAGLDTQGDITDGTQVIWDVSAQEIPDSAMGSIANATLTNDSVTVTAGNALTGGGTVALGGSITIDVGTIQNSDLANSSVTITAGDGLKNGGAVSLGGTTTIDIEPADFAGTFLSDDGADNLTVDIGRGIENDGSGNLRVDEDVAFAFTSAIDFGAGLDTQGDITDGTQVIWDASAQEIPDSALGTVNNSTLANSSLTVTAGDGLKGGGLVSLGGSTTLNIEPADFAGAMLADDGSDNLTISTGNGVQNDGGGNLEVDESFAFSWTAIHNFSNLVRIGSELQDTSNNTIISPTSNWLQIETEGRTNGIRLRDTANSATLLEAKVGGGVDIESGALSLNSGDLNLSSGLDINANVNSGTPNVFEVDINDAGAEDDIVWRRDPAATEAFLVANTTDAADLFTVRDNGNTSIAGTLNTTGLLTASGDIETGAISFDGDATTRLSMTAADTIIEPGTGDIRLYDGTSDLLTVAGNGSGVTVNQGGFTVTNVGSGSGTTAVFDGSNNLIKASSSRRYKENIRSMDANWSAVLDLDPVTFDFIDTGQSDFGYIAEEVAEVANELVVEDDEGRPDAVKYDRMVVHLVEMVKEQQQKINRLEDEVYQ